MKSSGLSGEFCFVVHEEEGWGALVRLHKCPLGSTCWCARVPVLQMTTSWTGAGGAGRGGEGGAFSAFPQAPRQHKQLDALLMQLM